MQNYIQYTGAVQETIDHAIRESVQERRIVHLIYSDRIAELLRRESDGEVDTGDTLEIWGVTIDGDEWRIRLER